MNAMRAAGDGFAGPSLWAESDTDLPRSDIILYDQPYPSDSAAAELAQAGSKVFRLYRHWSGCPAANAIF